MVARGGDGAGVVARTGLGWPDDGEATKRWKSGSGSGRAATGQPGMPIQEGGDRGGDVAKQLLPWLKPIFLLMKHINPRTQFF